MADRPTGSQKAVDTLSYLKARITRGEWPINTRIPKEPELMALIGVGKSTVREAVRSLASQGMLEPIKGVGTFVRSRTPVTSVLTDYLAEYSIEDVLVYRRALEMEAVRQAAVHRMPEHLTQLHAISASRRGRRTRRSSARRRAASTTWSSRHRATACSPGCSSQ